jgi:hypothetical protein
MGTNDGVAVPFLNGKPLRVGDPVTQELLDALQWQHDELERAR